MNSSSTGARPKQKKPEQSETSVPLCWSRNAQNSASKKSQYVHSTSKKSQPQFNEKLSTSKNLHSQNPQLDKHTVQYQQLGLQSAVKENALLNEKNNKHATQTSQTMSDKKDIKCHSYQNKRNPHISTVQFVPIHGDTQQQYLTIMRQRYNAKITHSYSIDTLFDQINEVKMYVVESNQKRITKLEKNLSFSSNDNVNEVIKLRLNLLEKKKKDYLTYIKKLQNEKYSDQISTTDIEIQLYRNSSALLESLWISAFRHEILEALEKSQVIIINGETGYGKSTLVPLYANEVCSQMGKVASCQPYHSAAIGLAKHVSEYLDVGEEIGLCLGKEHTVSNKTNIIFTTSHNLLQESVESPFLSQYSCIIIDECHDRSVDTDILLLKMKEIATQRSHFKLVLICSECNTSEYENYFINVQDVKVLSLPPITFPVNVYYNVLKDPNKYVAKAANLVDSIQREKPGNILVFLSTLQEAEKCHEILRSTCTLTDEIKCHILHSKSNCSSISKLFAGEGRKIIFTTNCAESLQLPNICYVIDSGKIKKMQHCKQKQTNILSTLFISKDSAERRRKLAGQVQNGHCYRLYTRQIFDEMEDVLEPAVRKSDPSQLILTMFYHRISDPINANFIWPIEKESLQDGLLKLTNFGAIEHMSLTPLGKSMSKIPLASRHAKLISLGREKGLGYETVIIAMFSHLNTPIFSTSGKSKDIGKFEFSDPDGDYFAVLNAYSNWKKMMYSSETWCKINGLNHFSLSALHKSVQEMCALLKIRSDKQSNDVHRKILIELICECFYDNICTYTGHFQLGYKSCKTSKILRIHNSSVFSYKTDNSPSIIVYDYITENYKYSFLTNITPVPDNIFKKLTKKNYMNQDPITTEQLIPVVIEPVGTILMKKVLLGKQGKKLGIIENEIKQNTGTDTVILDPDVENGSISIYVYPQYSESAKNIVSKYLKDSSEELRMQQENIDMPIGGNIILQLTLGRGALINKISEKISESQTDVSEEEENPCDLLRHYCINLSWLRRLCKGIGFVTMSSADDFETAWSHLRPSHNVEICGKNVRIYVSKKQPNQFYIEGLNAVTSHDDLKTAIEKNLPKHIKVLTAHAVLSSPYSETAKDIEIMKEELLLQFVRYLVYGNLDIKIPTPNSTDIAMKAYLNLDEPDDVHILLDAIKRDNIKFQDIPLRAIPVYRTKLICQSDLYNSIEMLIKDDLLELEDLTHNPNRDSNENLFRSTVVRKNDAVHLIFLSNDPTIMKEIETIVTNHIQGKVLKDFNANQLRRLFSHTGQQWLKQVAKVTHSYILQDFQKKTLRICGSCESYKEVKSRIEKYLKNIKNEIVCVINIPKSIIKTLVKRYHLKLDYFVFECGLTSVELSVQYGQLTLYGMADSIKKAQAILQNISAEVHHPISNTKNDCPVCLTTPESGLSHRLEYCGHNYCSSCIKLLVAEGNLPLKCCQEDCGKELVIEDIENVLEDNEEERQKLLYHSLKFYVERNHENVKFCVTPDCKMVYDTSSLEHKEEWTCPVCNVTVCAKCNTKLHPGMSCEMARATRKDDNYSLKVWISQNPEQRKVCPGCQSPIEKNGGCNHMACWKCQRHMCWLCLQVFASGTLVYDHLPYCSQNQKPYV